VKAALGLHRYRIWNAGLPRCNLLDRAKARMPDAGSMVPPGTGDMRGSWGRISFGVSSLFPLVPVLIVMAVTGPGAALAAGPIVFTQIPATTSVESTDLDSRVGLPNGSRLVLYDPSQPDAGLRVLTPKFVAAGRPDVSFDGKRILFVGRREASDPFGIWEIALDDPDRRPSEIATGHISKAIYLSTIYTLDADKPVYQLGFCKHTEAMPTGALYTCRDDGSRVRRITFNPYGATDPFEFSDGRLLFSRWLQPHDGTGGAADLMTVYTDGTDLFPFAAVHKPAAFRSMATETTDGWIIYVESRIGVADRGGSLMAVKRTRSLHTERVVADDHDGFYHSPSAMSDGSLLVSYRPREQDAYGLYLLNPTTGQKQSKVFDDPLRHDLHAVAFGPRPAPAGRSSVVTETFDDGMLYCMNAYLSDRDGSEAIRKGQIKRVQVFKALVAEGSADDKAPADAAIRGAVRPVGEVLLGEAPVRQDGSFALRVPAKAPLRLQTLDANGQVLQAMESFIWVMPRESRGCIGCHEDRELTPPNRHVEALRKEPHVIGLDPSKRPERAVESRYGTERPE